MLGDIKDFFPVEAFMPLMGGVLVWFGLNYIFLAPNIIAPRLIEKYYMPACIASAEKGHAAFIENSKKEEAEYLQTVLNNMKATSEAVQNAGRNALTQFFGAYGAQGEAYLRKYGPQVNQYADKLTGQAAAGIIPQQAQDALAHWQAERRTRIKALQDRQKYDTPAGFCRCNTLAALSDRFDLAVYTSSLRLFTPKGISALENGEVFEAQCGPVPVI